MLQALRDDWETTDPDPSSLINFWSEPSLSGPTDLMVKPDAIYRVEEILKANSIPYWIQMENVEKYLFIFF